jgi:hypothetical protein
MHQHQHIALSLDEYAFSLDEHALSLDEHSIRLISSSPTAKPHLAQIDRCGSLNADENLSAMQGTPLDQANIPPWAHLPLVYE